MKSLQFETSIDASPDMVWNTMLQPESYRQWVDVSWPGSFYEGHWAKDEILKFITPDQSGTMAQITEFVPYQKIAARHIAILLPGGNEDRESDVAKGWIGSQEIYKFSEKDGRTTLKVKVITQHEWLAMFNDGWPNALKKLKALSENVVV